MQIFLCGGQGGIQRVWVRKRERPWEGEIGVRNSTYITNWLYKLSSYLKFILGYSLLGLWAENFLRSQVKGSKSVNLAQNEAVLSPAGFRCARWMSTITQIYPGVILMQMWQISKHERPLGRWHRRRDGGQESQRYRMREWVWSWGGGCWSSHYVSTGHS